jgi:hypothetical protein
MKKQNFVVYRDTYDGEVRCVTYEYEREMFRAVSKIICFSDCDDSTDIVMIVADGREVSYAGWQPCMHYVFVDKETKEIVYENWFPHWEH